MLLEAKMGIPVVASDVGGIENYVNKQTGLLVPPKNPARLAESIRFSFAHPEETLRYGEALRLKIKAEFSLDRMLKETTKLYEDM